MGRLKITINRALVATANSESQSEPAGGHMPLNVFMKYVVYTSSIPQSAGNCVNTFRGQATRGSRGESGNRGLLQLLTAVGHWHALIKSLFISSS